VAAFGYWPEGLRMHWIVLLISLVAFAGAIFHHHPLFTNADGSKLSKSAGAASIQSLRREGKTPGEICAIISQKKIIIS